MSLSIVALGLYAMAGTGVLIVAFWMLRTQPSPAVMMILHAVFAVAGAATVLTFVLDNSIDLLFKSALIVYGAGALGGLFLASHKLRESFPPGTVMVGHSAIAAVGTVALLTTSV